MTDSLDDVRGNACPCMEFSPSHQAHGGPQRSADEAAYSVHSRQVSFEFREDSYLRHRATWKTQRKKL